MMETLNNLLLGSGDLALSAWEAIKAFFVIVFGAIDTYLGPVLSPLFGVLNPICTTLGDAMYAVLSPFPAWLGITFISAVTGVFMLIAFRYTSNQDAIIRVKDEIKAHLLALKLFKEDLRTVLLSQLRLLWAIAKLQRYVLTPVVIAMLPMLLLLAQMGVRYQWRPVREGEPFVLTMTVDSERVDPVSVTMSEHPGIDVVAGPVPGSGVVAWQLAGREPGRHELVFDVGGVRVEKQIVVGHGLERVSALRPGASWLDRMLHPVERPLPAGGPVESIEVVYPSVDSYICGADWWILYFFVVSMAVALIFKPVFHVKF